jgi:pyruvate-ferredoxin/flavodoxin oxidoreductase
MGTMADTCRDVVDYLRATGTRAGSIDVTSFRPFPARELAEVLASARAVAVVERTDEPAASANPLTREIKAALADVAASGRRIPRVVSASAGLGSRDVGVGDLLAVFKWLADTVEVETRPYAVLGIRHPLALAPVPLNLRPKGAFSVRGHSIGGFGSVTTNKLLAATVAELFGLYVQAYPRYGSEKRGLPTTFYLTVAEEPIRQHAELTAVDLVALYDVAAFGQGDPLAGVVDGGTVFLHSPLAEPAAIWESIPAHARERIASRGIRVVALDQAALAGRFAPRPELATRMQGAALVGVFLRIAPFVRTHELDADALTDALRAPLARFVGKRGGEVVAANLALIRAAYEELIDVTDALEVREEVHA